jgi:3-hydroxybutyryl-CoA dehydrogenase
MSKTIKSVGVVGAGTMGNGIAQAFATAGFPVVMVDISLAAIEKGQNTIAKSLDRLASREKITESQAEAAKGRILGTTDYDKLKGAHLVIEAATENFDIKVQILKQINGIVSDDTIIATNTSSISITALAATITHPERFIGLHFFNPVPMMALVEVIRGLQSNDETHAAVETVAGHLNKTAITVKNAPGFVVNRILVPMINEAFFVLAEGLATAEDIDIGMRLGCNHPIGPLALADMIGLDVVLSVLDVFLRELGDSKYRACPLLKEMVAAGRLGRKTGRGVYQYA